MSRPSTKQELLTAAESGWTKLWNSIDSMTEEQQAAPFTFDISGEKEAHWARDKNLRDVLTHLYEWHKLLLEWVEANINGDNKPFLPALYTWKTYGEMNVVFWEKHQVTTCTKAKTLLEQSHAAALALISHFTDDELFEKKHFPWTGTTSLGSYCVSATSSHYDWAMKKIKRHIKQQKTSEDV